ncbi:putative zinc-finger of transcription factor IIIC complex-domain-containing protein [Mycena sp. CBHHK59/15]|nr:putative zinc-finger of transcription factor IIIC complex-domain-containing protein [Mycena sp. CBHHK59/15]
MSSLPIYTSLNVPMVPGFPSATSFQWSADGQACVLTKTALYIMTPDHGLNFDPSATIKATPEKDKGSDLDPLGWYRTLIQFDRTVEYLWPGAITRLECDCARSVDISLNISPEASCILAALSSSMDLTLWTAGRNGLMESGLKFLGLSMPRNHIYDITPFLLDTFADEGTPSFALTDSTDATTHPTGIKWSQQADFGLDPTPLDNGSLLIAGNRAGMLLFLRYRYSSVELVDTLFVANKWVVCLAISSWAVVEPQKCEAYLAYATDDGVIGVVKIRQTLECLPGTSPFGLNCSIQLSIESGPVELCTADHRPAIALEWVEIRGGLVLAYCKAGVAYLWRSPHSDGSWSGLRALPIVQTQKLSVGMSPFHPVSGLHHILRKDALMISLSDGSFHMIHNLSNDPSWSPTGPGDITSETLSHAARSILLVLNLGPSTPALALRPADFSYKHDAKHNCIMLVARLWDDADDEVLLQDLSAVLQTCRVASGLSPPHLLRSIFFNLPRRRLNKLHSQILEIIVHKFDDHSVNITVAPWVGELSAEMRSEFRSSLGRHLFGWDVMLSLRMRLSVADCAWKASETPQKQGMSGLVAQVLLNAISHRVLRTIIRHLVAVVKCLTASDVPFVLRMVVQSLLPGSPPDLTSEGENLSRVLHDVVPSDSVVTGLNEPCPACKAEVPLQEITSAVCPNGHTWLRCSITTFILATPLVRTCVGCSRKAFLPLSRRNPATTENWLPEAGRGWVVEDLLEAVHRCLFCGNSFVSVL